MSAVAVLVMSGRHLAFLPEHFAEPYVRQKLMAPLNASVLRYDVPFQRAIKRHSSRNEVLRAFLDDLEMSAVVRTPSTSRPTRTISAIA
jgi:DNA-binding transcriptional LysR family regulator